MSETALDGSVHWPYVFPEGEMESGVAQALGNGGVGSKLRALKQHLRDLSQSGRIVLCFGDKGYEVKVGARPLSGTSRCTLAR